MNKLFLTICLLIVSSFSYAEKLNSVEIQIRDYILAKKAEQISLLEKMVNINSGTTNLSGVHEMGEMLRPEFEKLGFKTQWFEEPADMQRAGTLIAERHGKGKKIILIGHLDTVFPKDSPFQKFELRNKIASGPGVIDDKGGVIVILSALQALHAAHALEDTNITVVLTGDEEDSGKPTSISRKPLFAAALHADVALDFEPSVSINTGTIARRGVSSWIIESTGYSAHSSVVFHETVGAGAVFELSRVLNQMRAQLSKIKYLSFNPGIILGGTTLSYDHKNSNGTAFGKDNVIAKTALAQGDLRFISDAQRKVAEKKILEITKQHLNGAASTVTFKDGIPAMQPTEKNMQLLKEYSRVSEDLGLGKVKPLPLGIRGAGDISHIASIVPANIAGLGPVGDAIHTNKEKIELDSLPIQTQRTAILIYRLTR